MRFGILIFLGLSFGCECNIDRAPHRKALAEYIEKHLPGAQITCWEDTTCANVISCDISKSWKIYRVYCYENRCQLVQRY